MPFPLNGFQRVLWTARRPCGRQFGQTHGHYTTLIFIPTAALRRAALVVSFPFAL